MTGVTKLYLCASALLVAGIGGAAGATAAPVGSLCNAGGKIEVMSQVSDAACTAEPAAELKALLKARRGYQDQSNLTSEQRAQIDARIDRRLRELWKAKAAK